MGTWTTGDSYILILCDDHSGYSWLYPTSATDAEKSAHAIIDWCSAFGPLSGFMSDGPTRFKNEMMRRLYKVLNCRHHFTLTYTPWSNGAIELLGKEIFRTAREVISELLLSLESRPDLTLSYRAPLTMLLPSRDPLLL